ncbi:hypothetical protein WDU94_001412 [Cyamophila willieti]
MGSVCCKQGPLPQDHTVTSYYTKPSPGDLLCKEIKSQFRLCPNRRQQKIKQRRRFKKRNLRKERPSISSPRLLNPKYLTGEKWQNVILTIPDPKMKTRTPVPPPRKKRKSLINLCTKRNESTEYVNLPSNDDDCRDIFENNNLSTNKLYSSELELFKPINSDVKHSNLRRTVSYEDMTSLNAFYHVIKTSRQHVLNSHIHTCLLCYINEIMSLVEQLNRTNNEDTKFKLDDNSGDENDEVTEKQVMCESERQDGAQEDKETKLCEINEQKLLESLENFCIHCYLNKIQTHPKEREDISSTSTKVKENNLKSFQTGDNNNFSRANKNVGNKIALTGSTHDKTKFSLGEIEKDKESACANSMQAEEESSKQPQIEYTRLDKKYECLFCCINKKKTKQKHYSSNGGSLYEIYSKKQENNVFKSDNINEQECKYTIGNKVGDKGENKIRNEKLCEINNAQNKHIHDSNNMLEHFKNLNCCRRRHLNLFRYMCFQCFYVYVQIIYILQNSVLFNEDPTSSIFKMRKCEMMRSLSIKNIDVIVNMVQQIHSCYNGKSFESNVCQSCAQVVFPKESIQPPANLNKNQTRNVYHEESGIRSIDLKQNEVPHSNNAPSDQERLIKGQGKRFDGKQEVSRKKKQEHFTKNNEHHHDTTPTISGEKSSQEKRQTVGSNTKAVESVINKSAIATKILQNFEKTNDPSIVERRKDKFKKLMADLNSTKIGGEETRTDDRSQLIGKDRSRDVSEERINDIDNRKHQEMKSRDFQTVDKNGNYWNTTEVVNQSDVPPDIGKCQQQLIQDPLKQCDDNIHIKRNSTKRKSYKLKRPPENNPSEYAEHSNEDLSRKSSVTDSLYELEASLYEMLQNSPYFAMDDVEYV